MDSIQALVDLANALDEAKLTAAADRVDKISQNTAVIKKAQYVGVQGYWIRNKRCWENCYRQKRASNKEMPAQKVWTECHKEYLKSLNNDNADWNKYAEEKSDLKKFANIKNSDKILSSEKDYFKTKLAERIKQNWPIGNAVYDAFESGTGRRETSMLNEAKKVAKVAEDLKKAGHNELATQASAIATNMIKEAQFLNNMRGIGNQISNWWGQRQNGANFGYGNVASMIQQLTNTLDGYKAQKQKIQGMLENAISMGGQGAVIAKQMIPLLTTLNKTNLGKLNELAQKMEGAPPAQPAPANVKVPSTSGGMGQQKSQQDAANEPEPTVDQIDQEIGKNMQDANGDGLPDRASPTTGPGGVVSGPAGSASGVTGADPGSWSDVQGNPSPQNFEGVGYGAEQTPSRAGGPEVVRPMTPTPAQPAAQPAVPKKRLAPRGKVPGMVANKNPDLYGRVALGSVLKRIKTY